MIRRTFRRMSTGLAVLATVIVLLVHGAGSPALALTNLFGSEEPLPVDEAFVPSIKLIDNDTISVEFAIENAYYLYRDKLKFSLVNADDSAVTSQSATLSAPIFGESIIISDDFFGDQAIFRDSTIVTLPYTLTSANPQNVTLSVKFQGCADMGLCYPPTTTLLSLELPAPATPVRAKLSSQAKSLPNAGATNPLANIFESRRDTDELLPPERAYLPRIATASADTIDVKWIIEDGYYLYRDKISFTLDHPAKLQISKSVLSDGTDQHDEFFGNVSVLRHAADAAIQLAIPADVAREKLEGTQGTLIISYQGCADIGVCFPPSEATLPVVFGAITAAPSATVEALSAATVDDGKPDDTAGSTSQPGNAVGGALSEQDRLSRLLGTSTLWITVATFFGLGLLLSFTPCVLPMIPILSSLVIGQGKSVSTGRAFQLSLVYVLVMASTYAVVGVIVALSGYNIQAYLQHPYVLSAIAVVFVLLSLSMFGFYELQVPASVQGKLTQLSNKQGGGRIGGVAAMGFISTLIVGPCVTAPLAGALIYIAKTGDAMIGGAALFALGLGMGAPLLVIGTSAGKLLPKAGAWMDTTKHIFGILMLGMAVYMVSRFLPTTIIMGLYGILAVMTGVYLGATDATTRQSSGWQRFGKGAGLVVALYGVALLVGALAGGSSYTTPLRSLTASSGSATQNTQNAHGLAFERIKSIDELQSVVAKASSEGRPVMLDFYADWCISCKEMEAFTFTDEQVQGLLENAILVQADVTANDGQDQALLKQFDLFGPPGIIFYNTAGTELPAARVVGFMNAENFSEHIRRFLTHTDT